MRSKMTVKGQITIPVKFRNKLGLNSGNFVELSLNNNSVVITKPTTKTKSFLGIWKNSDFDEESVKKMWDNWI